MSTQFDMRERNSRKLRGLCAKIFSSSSPVKKMVVAASSQKKIVSVVVPLPGRICASATSSPNAKMMRKATRNWKLLEWKKSLLLAIENERVPLPNSAMMAS
jgi:hypothetical protein